MSIYGKVPATRDDAMEPLVQWVMLQSNKAEAIANLENDVRQRVRQALTDRLELERQRLDDFSQNLEL